MKRSIKIFIIVFFLILVSSYSVFASAVIPPKMDTLPSGYLVVGKYMMYVPKMTQKHFDGAVKTGEPGQPMYYKSEFADGTWYRIQDVTDIKDISLRVSQNIEKASKLDQIKFMVQVNEKGELIKFEDAADGAIDDIKADIAKKKSEIANAIDGVDPVSAKEAVDDGDPPAVLTPEKLAAGKANPAVADALDRLEGELVELENALIAVLLSLEGEEEAEGTAMLQGRLDAAAEAAMDADNLDALFETMAEMVVLDPEKIPENALGLVVDGLVDDLGKLIDQTTELLGDSEGFVADQIEEAKAALAAIEDKISDLGDQLEALADTDDAIEEMKEQLEAAIEEQKKNEAALTDLKEALEVAILDDKAKEEVIELLELAILEHEAKAEAVAILAKELGDDLSDIAEAVGLVAGGIDVAQLAGDEKKQGIEDLLSALKDGAILPDEVQTALENLANLKPASTWVDDTYSDINRIYSLLDKMRLRRDYIDMYIKENDDDNLHSKELILAIIKEIDIEIAMMREEVFIDYDVILALYRFLNTQGLNTQVEYSQEMVNKAGKLREGYGFRLQRYEALSLEGAQVDKIEKTKALDTYIFKNFLEAVLD